ncbi:MAG: SHD1 domain-containing protein [Planctomycetota bacterium]|jgi:uncharacterized protein with FMN-binding domain
MSAGSVRADPVEAIEMAATVLAQHTSDTAVRSSAARSSGVRTWADSTGKFKVEAELVDCRDGQVRLKKIGGRIVSLPLNRLSAADREYVKQMMAKGSASSGTGTDRSSWVGKSAEIEFLSGAKNRGQITTCDDKYIAFKVKVGSRVFSRKYPLEKIRAVTIDGKREVLNEGGSGPPRRTSATRTDPRTGTAPVGSQRTVAQVEALIAKVGREPPDWWDSVALTYPKSLDLSWPQKPPPPWNNQKNVGQYLWDIIQPNPRKWREGIRFVHSLLEMHKSDGEKRVRAMNTLGRLYFLLLQDYARAAYWWRQAGVGPGNRSPAGVNLAACYWRLGNKQMAMELLQKIPLYYSSIKLLADMGETQTALRLAESAARGGTADMAYLYAGDACRIEGQYRQAIGYYQKVLDVPATGKEAKRVEQSQQRARANIEAIRIFDTLDLRKVPDGTYRGKSPAYGGELHVEVAVRSGRIESVKVVQHKEKQFYTALTDTPRQIIEKQGVKGIDATSSATITSEAIINATAKALSTGIK